MTPRGRVEAVLRREVPDRTPFTIYENKLPQCSVERRLRNEGLCIVNRKYPVVEMRYRRVSVERHEYQEDGVTYVRTVWHTPDGDLVRVDRPAGFTSWQVEHVFKGPEDYKKLMWLIVDPELVPCYEKFLRAQESLGEDVFLRVGIGSTPLHQIMIGWMGVERFSLEWAERRDEVLKLYHALADRQRRIFPIIARSPALAVNYGGNETPEVMGPPRFREYVIPLYNEAAEVLHRHGKLLGAHLDGNNRAWAQDIAKSGLDYIEAFTPAPDTDMSLREALDAWPDKVLWINFPSSVHLSPVEEVERTAAELIGTAPKDRFIMGITEDIPEDRWQENLLAISRAINQGG